MVIDTPGAYELDEKSYHSDICVEPSVSSGLIRKMERSPLHAWYSHPRLNPEVRGFNSTRLDQGSLAHTLVLGKGDDILVIDAADWRSKEAQEKRTEARKKNLLAVLHKDYERAAAMAEISKPYLPTGMEIEIALFWKHKTSGEPRWCRAKPDGMYHERNVIFDFKTVGKSAHPDAFARHALDFGYDAQAAFYINGYEAIYGTRPRFIFVAQEMDPPYSVSMHEFDEEVLDLARHRINRGMDLWDQCLRTNEWPGYTNQINTMQLPPWKRAKRT